MSDSTSAGFRARYPLIDRFMALVSKTGIGDNPHCWRWTGSIFRIKDGDQPYGRMRIGGRLGVHRHAHRIGYELLVEPVPPGLQLDHLCRNRLCVNPAHLEPVTGAENMRRSPLWGGRYQRAKTHCKRGHAYDAANTYRRPDGGRDCRICRATHCVASAQRRKAVAA